MRIVYNVLYCDFQVFVANVEKRLSVREMDVQQ